MADQYPVQADGAGVLDLNKLPEMQQQPDPQSDGSSPDVIDRDVAVLGEKPGEDADRADDGALPDADPQMGVALDNG
jgi:hypothetical protein